jgi:hypothetical protein
MYHEKLFLYEDAFALNKQWLSRHPDDRQAEANFAEVYITTGRLTEAQDRLEALLSNSGLPAATLLGLRALEIVNLVALKKTDSIPGKLDALQEVITSQPNEFIGEWTFEGTKHFVAQSPLVEKHRNWLLDLLAGLEGKKRNEMVVAIEAARKTFQPSAGSRLLDHPSFNERPLNVRAVVSTRGTPSPVKRSLDGLSFIYCSPYDGRHPGVI